MGMTVQYEFRLEDIMAATAHATKRTAAFSKSGRGATRLISWVMLLVILAAFLAPLFISSLNSSSSARPLTMLIPFVTMILVLVILGQIAKRFSPNVYKGLADQGILGTLPRTVTAELFDDGVRFKSQDGDTMVTWRGVVSVEQDDRYVYLFAIGLMCFAIPVRAFESAQEAEAFRHEASRRMYASDGPGSRLPRGEP